MGTVPVANATELHFLNRFSYGVSRPSLLQLRGAGGASAWLTSQLAPAAIPAPEADEIDSWFPRLDLTPYELWRQLQTGSLSVGQVVGDVTRRVMLRRIYSPRQLSERMTELWSNHFNVPAGDDKSWPLRAPYEQVMRQAALGKFSDLLVKLVLHPAMLCYLDAARSTSGNPNENLGRELLELHTVGHGAGFGEDDVQASMRLLTGWMVDQFQTWTPFYSNWAHATGPVQVLDFTAANSAPNGRATTKAYLNHLAHHPATARRVALRIATHFVSDNPAAGLVDRMAAEYLRTDTSISAVVKYMSLQPEFASSAGLKVRTPSEDLIATWRAMRATTTGAPVASTDASSIVLYLAQTMGQLPYAWPRPDGYPDVADAWSSSIRMIKSWNMHGSFAGSTAFTSGGSFPAPSTWLPVLPAPLSEVGRTMCRLLLHRDPSPAMLQGISQACGYDLSTSITPNHPAVTAYFPRLLHILLDSPQHMKR